MSKRALLHVPCRVTAGKAPPPAGKTRATVRKTPPPAGKTRATVRKTPPPASATVSHVLLQGVAT